MADPKKRRAPSSKGGTRPGKSRRSSGSDTPRRTPPSGGGGSNRAAKKGAESIGYLVLVVVVLVLANVAGYFVHFRSDWTEANRYSLSQGSERLVSNLDEEMEITAYFTPDLPQPYNTIEPYVRNLLEEYQAASGGKLRITFVDPDEDEEKEQARQDGVLEIQHPGYENDSVSVKVGFRGLVIRYLGERQTIPVIHDTSGLEYEITMAIRQLVRDPLPVGIAMGHGSPSLTKGLGSLRAALPHYELREVDVSTEIDSEIRALLLINPAEPLTDTEQRRINEYVMGGGNLGVFGGTMNVTLEGAAPSASQVDTGVNTLLANWGISLGDSLVADAHCGRVPLRTQFGLQIPVAYPPAPIISFDEDQRQHSVLFRLSQAPFFFSAPIETTAAFDTLDGEVLARSSEDASWLLEGEAGGSIGLQPRDPREWTIGASRGPHTVLVAIHHQLPSAFTDSAGGIEPPAESAEPVRLLVAGSGAVLRDEFLPNEQQRQGGGMTGGLAFALNAVDWLAADEDLVAIRAKNIEDPAIDVPQDVRRAQEDFQEAVQQAHETGDESAVESAVEEHEVAMEAWESRKLMYRLFAMGGVPLLVLLFGALRYWMRKNKRSNLQALRKKLVRQRG